MLTMIKALLVPALLLGVVLPAHAEGTISRSSSSSSSSSTNNSSKSSESHSSSSTHFDQDDARDALRQGKVMPLAAILEIVGRRVPGTVLDAELETEDGVLTYKIDVLSEAGRKTRVRLNARSGAVIAVQDR